MKARIACGMALLGLALAVVVGMLVDGEPGAVGNAAAWQKLSPAPRTPALVGAGASASPAGNCTGEDSLLAILQAETDLNRGSEAVQRAVDSVPDGHLHSVLDALLLNTNATELCSVLTRRWAEKDLPAAASWAESLVGNAFQGEALRQVALAWANSDLATAAEWAKGLPEDLNKAPALAGVAYEACRTEPLLGLDLMLDSAAGPERDDFLVHALSQWAGVDSLAAWEWASQVPEPALRGQLLAAVAVATAEQEGAVAAELVATSLPAGPEQERAAVAVAQRWAAKAPQEAACWAARFPDSIRASAVQNVVTLWKDRDSAAAAVWLQELPEDLRAELGLATSAQSPANLRE